MLISVNRAMTMKHESQLERDLAAQIALYNLPLPVREYRFDPAWRWRFDFAWPERKFAVECEGGIWTGGRHSRGRGFESDCRKYNTAAIGGWTILRFTGGMVRSWEAVRTIREYLGVNLQ
jgi:very-short-patch-repair endonuclease